jgi:hypothetical protein
MLSYIHQKSKSAADWGCAHLTKERRQDTVDRATADWAVINSSRATSAEGNVATRLNEGADSVIHANAALQRQNSRPPPLWGHPLLRQILGSIISTESCEMKIKKICLK